MVMKVMVDGVDVSDKVTIAGASGPATTTFTLPDSITVANGDIVEFSYTYTDGTPADLETARVIATGGVTGRSWTFEATYPYTDEEIINLTVRELVGAK
jgi:hypothetical protein